MNTDTIVYGETYDINLTAQDSEGQDIVLDSDWSAAIRFTDCPNWTTTLLEDSMVISDGVATSTYDTGEDPWKAGILYYDIRLTDVDGNDYWTEPVKLIIKNRITQSS